MEPLCLRNICRGGNGEKFNLFVLFHLLSWMGQHVPNGALIPRLLQGEAGRVYVPKLGPAPSPIWLPSLSLMRSPWRCYSIFSIYLRDITQPVFTELIFKLMHCDFSSAISPDFSKILWSWDKNIFTLLAFNINWTSVCSTRKQTHTHIPTKKQKKSSFLLNRMAFLSPYPYEWWSLAGRSSYENNFIIVLPFSISCLKVLFKSQSRPSKVNIRLFYSSKWLLLLCNKKHPSVIFPCSAGYFKDQFKI